MELISAKKILSNWSDGSSWFGSNYGMNIYKGCSHGCIYCDSRSECYRVERFDEVRAKENVLQLLEQELMSKRRKGIVANGAMSDPYNPQEAKYKLTRASLELLDKYGFGGSLLTKSNLILRDLDILQKIRSHSPMIVKFTITTFDDSLCKKVEPKVSVTSKRLDALEKIASAGLFTGILLWPLLPFINDTEENIEAIVEAAAHKGASFVAPMFGVTLRQNQRVYFYQQLDKLFPGVKEKYIKTYGYSYECYSINQDKLYKTFKALCKKHGLIYKMSDIRRALIKPYETQQISFLR
ncbi:SPL family radical SAM protein [Alkaliphilus serpentinus]|uniref:Radical SAM protein n=1 Tax=Alkaliphilus serpentinus TaxID=1482731 RepID=A0A833HN30_9FIRM|nr:radical SAM protein [Alkaliphilus serpentinus]KAB3529174.1 radical SAM protein [Alkaliphilus serpentinus]